MGKLRRTDGEAIRRWIESFVAIRQQSNPSPVQPRTSRAINADLQPARISAPAKDATPTRIAHLQSLALYQLLTQSTRTKTDAEVDRA